MVSPDELTTNPTVLAILLLTWWECVNGHWNADCESSCVTCGGGKK